MILETDQRPVQPILEQSNEMTLGYVEIKVEVSDHEEEICNDSGATDDEDDNNIHGLTGKDIHPSLEAESIVSDNNDTDTKEEVESCEIEVEVDEILVEDSKETVDTCIGEQSANAAYMDLKKVSVIDDYNATDTKEEAENCEIEDAEILVEDCKSNMDTYISEQSVNAVYMSEESVHVIDYDTKVQVDCEIVMEDSFESMDAYISKTANMNKKPVSFIDEYIASEIKVEPETNETSENDRENTDRNVNIESVETNIMNSETETNIDVYNWNDVKVKIEGDISEMSVDARVGEADSDLGENVETQLSCVCEKCWLNFETEAELKAHEAECDIQLSCPICCRVLPNRTSFASHIEGCELNQLANAENEVDIWDFYSSEFNTLTCNKCNSMFTSSSSFTVHYKACRHSLKCRSCKVQFPDKRAMKEHQCANKPVFSCGMCGKVFRKCHVLKLHMKIHSNERSHVCTVCSKTFLHKHQLKNHLNKHGDERNFKCDQCEQTFKYQSNLRKHKQTHVDPRNRQKFHCKHCNHAFFTRYHLTRHESVNCEKIDIERKYSCEYCSWEFKHKNGLNKHIRQVHQADSTCKRVRKMQTCAQCGKKFFWKKHLRQHMRSVHGEDESSDSESAEVSVRYDDKSDDEDSNCEEDSKSEVNEKTISNEEKIMKNLKKRGEYECSKCDRVFRSAGNLNRHMNLMHDE